METTTKKLGITKGEWIVDGYQVTTGIEPTDETICEFKIHSEYPSVFERSALEANANAQLIAEAGTVANETGKTPKMMQDHIKKLEGTLRRVYLNLQIQSNKNMDVAIHTDSIRADLRNAIAESKDQDPEMIQIECESLAQQDSSK